MTSLIATIKKYAKGIIGALGYAASLAVALGLTHYHWVAVVLAALATVGIVGVPNTPKPPVK